MTLRFETDLWNAGEWDGMADGFANANVFQLWHYGELHSQGPMRKVSRAALLAGTKCHVMAQFRIKKLPLGPGVAEVEWGPLFDRARFSEQRHLVGEFLVRAREEYCIRRQLDMRIIPRGTLSAEQDGQFRDIFQQSGFHHNEAACRYRTVIVDVARDLPAIRKALDRKWRNHLNVAERAGMTLEIGGGPELFERFYRLYQEMWARKRFATGMRVSIIRKMQRVLPQERRMNIAIARDGGQDVGATVCASCGDTLLYYLGATSPRLRRSCRPGYLLQWSNIAAAREKGFRWYDTGGMPDDEASEITEFKTRMNGEIVQFPGRFDATAGKTPSRLFATAEHVYWRGRHVLTGR